MKRFDKQEINAIVRSMNKLSSLSGYTNKYLGGEEVQKFEKEFASFHGCKYGVSVNSGTSALFVAQKAAGVSSSKDRVAIPCLTFTATTSQVLACRGKPVFIDIDPTSYCMNFDFTVKANYAIPVHLLGHPCKSEMIKEMKENHIFVIEDCAQATGAKYDNGKMVGSIGNCGIFSFQETKHITTLGEGGMIITNDEEFAEKCRKIRNHGEYYKDDDTVGYNFRLTETQAAFGRIQLKKLPRILASFRINANFIMKNLPELILPPKITNPTHHSFLILGCKFNNKKSKVSRNIFLEQLTKNRKKFLDVQSDIKGLNFKPGRIISSGYSSVQYEIPLYQKFTPNKKCVNGEQYVEESFFIDIHRWRNNDEIKEELQILDQTSRRISS